MDPELYQLIDQRIDRTFAELNVKVDQQEQMLLALAKHLGVDLSKE